MKKTITILFVCTGNTCRSVMAQGLFQKMWEEEKAGKHFDVEALSAGVAALDGDKASREALETLREEGVDLSAHCSSQLTPEMINKAHYIYTMTLGQKNHLLSNFPEARDKIFLLTGPSGEKDAGDIPDPFGLSLEKYRSTAAKIKEALRKVIWKINNDLAKDKLRE